MNRRRRVLGGLLLGLLVPLSGCVADDPEQVSTPSPYATLPPQQADSVREYELGPGPTDPPYDMKRTSFETGGLLIGPHYAIRLNWLAVGPALAEPLTYFGPSGPSARRAPEGQELVVFGVDPQIRSGQWTLGDRPKPKAELVVGEQVTKLKGLPLEPDSDFEVKLDSLVVVASVPKGAPVRLRVTDEGRTQTMDVRTGELGNDAIEAYYRPYSKRLKWSDKTPASVSVLGGSDYVEATFDVHLEGFAMPASGSSEPTAMLAPYAPGEGWAKPGRAWLVLPAPRVTDTAFEVGEPPLTLALRNDEAFRLVLPDGTEAKGSGGSRKIETVFGDLDDVDDAVYDVPADFRKGTYVIDLATASVLVGYRDGDYPGSWSRAPETLEVPIRMG